ncbi:ATP-binding protein [Anaerolinea thermophila]|uniref:ATP-binding protein n=1 Tax=Anaerolinea thermophila TaxID=167964 RepID=UPI0026F08A69|nr:ATP-binding protein [Anaerolinea thermophila]
MEFIPGFVVTQPQMILPNHVVGWLGWLLFVGLILLGLKVTWENPTGVLRRRWWFWVLLFVLVPVTTLTMAIRLPGQSMPLPGVPQSIPPMMLIFSAFPWVLAAGILGPFPAVVTGAFTGLMLGLFHTNSLFAPLEIAGLALAYSFAIRQRYRTQFFHVLRHPLGAALVLAVAYAPVYMLSMLFAANGSLAVRLDYAITQTWWIMLARAGEMLLASVVGEILYLTRPLWWGCMGPLLPTPIESSLKTRFYAGTIPLVAVLFITLTVGDWLVAGNAARQLVQDQLANTAQMAAESIPYFLEAGQSLILTLATPDLLNFPPDALEGQLSTRLRSVPFFREMVFLNQEGKILAAYPQNNIQVVSLSEEELAGVDLALKGVPSQMYTVPAVNGESSAQISFLAGVKDSDGMVRGVLLGRTDLISNPFTQATVHAIQQIQEKFGGTGLFLDEYGTVIYPVGEDGTAEYTGTIPQKPFEEALLPDGRRGYIYARQTIGRPWSIILFVPAEYTQQLALRIAIPLLLILILVSALAFVLLRLGLTPVVYLLQELAGQANLIARGDLDRPLPIRGEDEIARLGFAFEQMRKSLKARLDELNRLLVVSQGVAQNLEIHKAVQPVLEAALQDGACLARVVLIRDVVLEAPESNTVSFGEGRLSLGFAYLDEPLFDFAEQHGMASFPNPARMRRLTMPSGKALPGALAVVAIRYEGEYFGVLWVAYEQPHTFSDEEMRFLSTLAGQVAVAAASARLYAMAEIGRQRLEAVLASSPEPVLVVDEKEHLLLLNQAALQVPGLLLMAEPNKPIHEVVAQPDLVALLKSPLDKRVLSREITFPNNRVYYASVSAVMAEGKPVGRICTLRDITHFKELDQIKSDFVATVSHGLRSPLTLMKGYTTMLQMVGELNDQQKTYVQKIISSVETMSRLVNNLLDLGRIEAGIGLQIEKVMITQVVDEVLNALQPQATQKQIELEKEWTSNTPLAVVEGDRALLQQALYNLVENAIKYTPAGGKVSVRLEERHESLVVRVIDTGIGIAPLDLPRLFEKFYRSGRRESYQQRGSGLGLAIVKSIVDRHHGRVWVESQLGKGSTFSMELPFRQPVPQPVRG